VIAVSFVLSGLLSATVLVIILSDSPRPTVTVVHEKPYVESKVALGEDRKPDPVLTSLDWAKAAHAAELNRLKLVLLTDIDAEIRAAHKEGRPINYMLQERKGFADGGVTPLLPPLQPATRRYLAGVRAAEAALDAAYDQAATALAAAGRESEGERLRLESKISMT
jgi:hypothetical protein